MANKTNKPKQGKTIPDVLPKTGYSRWQQLEPFMPFSRETWRLLVKDGAPKPTYLSKRCKIYPNAEVHRWFADPKNYQAN
ncbi:MAG: hypothetical protein BWK73_52440 [Thiothrix lacustris]|uniref:Uncharacterized protein n=1 Tax=Thiothrix lacustris TaxID=525917 RepID=A0A1Y1Q7N2_9GAMM|nr:MAG: hypothetical protein BWK73_52440 [Thiothrix lacustris]